MGRLVGHTNHMMTSAAVLLVLSLSLSSVIGETQDRFFFGGSRPGMGGFRPGMGGFGGGMGGFRPGGDISRGDENIEYLTPFSYASNEAHTELVDTGDNGIDATAVLVFRQPGRISVEENLKGCNQGAIFGRRVAAAELVSKYELSGPIAGNLFWTKFSTTTEELLCYMTKCTGVVFPFPIAGVIDGPECSQ